MLLPHGLPVAARERIAASHDHRRCTLLPHAIAATAAAGGAAAAGGLGGMGALEAAPAATPCCVCSACSRGRTAARKPDPPRLQELEQPQALPEEQQRVVQRRPPAVSGLAAVPSMGFK